MRRELPRLMFAAPRSGSGKTLITCGFLEVLKRMGRDPRALKCGPDYIDPMFHRYVLGIPGANLDSFFLDGERLREALMAAGTDEGEAEAGESGRIAVLEGVMGYYDGLGGISSEASSYDVARLTETPVVLVLDCKGASLSLAAEAKGFAGLRSDSRIRGVILNRLSPMLYERLGEVIGRESGLRVFGYLPESESYRLESRHLGLFLPEEIGNLRQTIGNLADQMEKTLEIGALLELAENTPALNIPEAAGGRSNVGRKSAEALQTCGRDRGSGAVPLRIGVARDEAFCFYYQENLRLMRELGAELVYFSPIHDRELPDGLSGLLLGGGYPENYAEVLSKNRTMRESVRTAVSDGLPLLAECGGFLYLHESLEGSDGKEYPMAGVIRARAYRTGTLGRFGYITLTAQDGRQIKGHEFHYWESTAPGESWLAQKPAGGRSWRCMHESTGQISGFPHLYYPSNPAFLSDWLQFAKEKYRKKTAL